MYLLFVFHLSITLIHFKEFVISKQYFIPESVADDSDKDISYRPGNIFDTTSSHDSNNQSLENEAKTTGTREIVLEATTDIPEFSGSAQKKMKMSYKNDHSLSTQENHISEHSLFISPSTAAENETDQCMYNMYNFSYYYLLINILFSYAKYFIGVKYIW